MTFESTACRLSRLPWTEVGPGVREKRMRVDDTTVRMLQLDAGFEDPDWCLRGHVGYVIQGELQLQFASGEVVYGEGDALVLAGGSHSKHRAKASKLVTLFLVETSVDELN